jgi:hypothetical protein
MSQRRRGGGRKRSSSQRMHEEEEEDMETQTQDPEEGGTQRQGGARAIRAFNMLDQETIERKVGEIVRYLLCAERRKAPVKKAELIDKVVGSEFSASFSCLMPLVKDKLSDIFGITVEEVVPVKKKADGSRQMTTIRYFVLTNNIAARAREALLPCSEEEREEKGLLFVILALIMLKEGSMQEEHLWNVLTRLGIDASLSHPKFGDVESLIRKDFVEAKYLERDKTTGGDQYRYIYYYIYMQRRIVIVLQTMCTYTVNLPIPDTLGTE